METLQSFLKEFAIFDPAQDKSALPQGDDMQLGMSSQDDDTVVNVKPEDDVECECTCQCDCCQKNREKNGVDDNIEIIDPKNDDEVDFNIEDNGNADEEDQDDPMKDYDIF